MTAQRWPQAVLLAAFAVSLSGCASTDGLTNSIPGMHPAEAPTAVTGETFAYRAAGDRSIKVTVEKAIMAGSPDFLPGDPNWLELRLNIANIGGQTVKIVDVKEKLADNTVVAGASHTSELIKPPSMVKSGIATLGLAGGGMIIGSMLFPPAAILGGAAAVFAPMFTADRAERRIAEINKVAMQADALAPGTNVRGDVFVPAIVGQSGLVVFYEVNGQSRSLLVERDHG